MRKFEKIDSIAVPWLMPNVDTDIITPMRRLILDSARLDYYSFEPLRFIDGDGDAGILNPDFPLNNPMYKNAQIMIVGENFGCGSSRETAPEAIARCGIYCIIGSSFGGIFYKNCFQQGVLPIIFPLETVERLAEEAKAGGRFCVDLENRAVCAPNGEELPFQVEPFRAEALLKGLDDVDITLNSRDKIQRFFQDDHTRRPWLYQDGQNG